MAYNILVVDDSLPTRSIIKKAIKTSGFKVGRMFDASNGREALDVLNREWLDLVLTDYNMPVMNGLELIKEMKKDSSLENIPIVIVTTEGSRKRVEEFLESGASDYIKKPFTPEEVRLKLNRIIGESEDEQGDADFCDEGLDF